MASRRKIGEERLYYSPPALRRLNQQQQQLKANSTSSVPERREFGSDSYLDRFLDSTTPVVPAHHLPKTTVRTWRNRDSEFNGFFILGDLWEFFTEWSVYGAGVPLALNGSDSVVQYYVPSLSGIQLYIDPSRHAMEQRGPCDDGNVNSSRETSSDGDGECVTGGGANNSNRKSWNQQSTTAQGHNRLAGRNNPSMGATVDMSDISSHPGLLIFEYFEKELPFHREPLADKISILAAGFPEIKTYRSCDLAPASWISVAWYPIYRIPVGPTLQNIDACFLTFHFLAKPIRSSERNRGAGNKVLLPTFGLVSYKFKVSDWNANGVHEDQKASSLLQAADNWLRLLQVNHPDYLFFISHNTNW